MGFLLIIIVWILTPILEVINFIVVMCLNAKAHSFFKVVNGFFASGSLDRDRFGNHNYRASLNLFLIKKEGYKFGNILETISSVLGKNQRDKTLTGLGWFFVYLLWAVDYPYWHKGGHCINAINNNL